MAKGRKTGGRAKGVPNKINADLRQMILGALDAVGGAKYLQRQADENPQAFMALVGRTLPREIKAELTAGTLRVVLDGQGVRDA